MSDMGFREWRSYQRSHCFACGDGTDIYDSEHWVEAVALRDEYSFDLWHLTMTLHSRKVLESLRGKEGDIARHHTSFRTYSARTDPRAQAEAIIFGWLATVSDAADAVRTVSGRIGNGNADGDP